MNLETTIRNALAPLVGGRVHASTIPQTPAVPTTPAIVFTFVSTTPTQDICGAGSDDEADSRVQVDVYSTSFDGARALRLQIIAAMAAIDPPMIWQGDNGALPYEADLKLHRCSVDFVYYPSSV